MKASLPMRLNLVGSQMCSRFTQCEKVDPQMASIRVLDRSTKTSCLQFSQANGPRKLMSGGSFRYSMPDELKLPSGPQESDEPDCTLDSQVVWTVSAKSTWDSARQLSKAYGEIWTPGASSLVSPSSVRMHRSEQHSANARRPKFTHPGATTWVSAWQPWKAPSLMHTTVVGNLTSWSW